MVTEDRIFAATPDEFDALQDPATPAITIFLYRVTVNSEMRNSPPRMLSNGRLSRPPLPLELHYLITPWARDTRDEFRIIGRVMQVLYDRSELGPAELQGSSWSTGDSVQVILDSLPIEDHLRIWDTTDLPYRLSLTYCARVVGIEPEIAEEAAIVASAQFTGGVS